MYHETSLLQPATDFLGQLGDLYGKVKLAEAEAETKKYELQLWAMRDQLATPEFDMQSVRQPTVYDGFGVASGGVNVQSIAIFTVIGIGLFLALRG